MKKIEEKDIKLDILFEDEHLLSKKPLQIDVLVIKKDKNVLVAGRALMIIYPDLDYHIFVTADLVKRIERKLKVLCQT